MQAMKCTGRLGDPALPTPNTVGDYEQCCNVALRYSVISPKTPGRSGCLNRYAISQRPLASTLARTRICLDPSSHAWPGGTNRPRRSTAGSS